MRSKTFQKTNVFRIANSRQDPPERETPDWLKKKKTPHKVSVGELVMKPNSTRLRGRKRVHADSPGVVWTVSMRTRQLAGRGGGVDLRR